MREDRFLVASSTPKGGGVGEGGCSYKNYGDARRFTWESV